MPKRITNLGDLDPAARAALLNAAREMAGTIADDADKVATQALLEAMWALAAEHEPDLATMALALAALTARCLIMFADMDGSVVVMTPALSMLTANLIDQQLAQDAERAGHA
jgi:hypothetical protein